MAEHERERKVRRTASILVALVVGGLIFVSLKPHSTHPGKPAPKPLPIDNGAVQQHARTNEASTEADPSTGKSLNPPQSSEPATPLASRIAALDEAALQGDDYAACEISVLLTKCRSVQQGDIRRTAVGIEQRLNSSDTRLDPESVTAMHQALDEYRRLAADCENVPIETFDALPWHLHQTAMAGNTHAMAELLSGKPVKIADLVADPQLYAVYRESGTAYFQHALDAGEPMLLMGMAEVAIGGNAPLEAALPDEWRNPELLGATSNRMINEVFGIPTGTPSDPGAAARGAELYERYFTHSAAMRRFETTEAPLIRNMLDKKSGWQLALFSQESDGHCESLRP